MNKLYGELAPDWYRLLSPLEGYEEEANDYQRILLEYAQPLPRTMLELGSGAGHVAYYFRQWYHMTLSDLSPQMLDLSRKINPDCNHFLGDMRTLRLGETFDAVFIHDAIMYMLTTHDLSQAVETARIHCKPGGYILISPDDTAESFHPAVDQGGEDGGGRGLRYLSWSADPDPSDTTYTVDYVYLLRGPSGEAEAVHDRHVEGLFTKSTWFEVLAAAGFEAVAVPDSSGRTNFFGRLKT